MPTFLAFLSEPPALVLQVVLCCWFFMSRGPKLARYGVLSLGCSLAIEAIAFESMAARVIHTIFIVVAAGLLTAWSYQVTNRPRKGAGPASQDQTVT